MRQDVIVFLDCRGFNGLFHKTQTEESGKNKSKKGPYGEADGGINGTQESSVKITANDASHVTGYRGEYHLKDLQGDKDDFIEGIEGLDEMDRLSLICEIDVEAALDEPIYSQSNQGDQEGEF